MAKAKRTSAKANGFTVVRNWLAEKGLKPFAFQEEAWQAWCRGESGLVNAPTGFGKTFSIFLAAVIDYINNNPDYTNPKSKIAPLSGVEGRNPKSQGLQLLWVTPLRALAKDIHRAMEIALAELSVPWRVGVRNGDTSVAERSKQTKAAPEILIITPESLHLLLATKNHEALFQNLQGVAVDEWHELLGSKRGVQVELAVSHLKAICNKQFAVCNSGDANDCRLQTANCKLRIWSISATIGNLEEACQVLLGDWTAGTIVRAKLSKEIAIRTLLPETVERFPWAGHLGLKMVNDVLPIIHSANTTLLFTNVRSQSERWYQALLEADPTLAGQIALHHSAIDGETRAWVEDQLHEGTLKVVVCTASLDLGVDFRPVDNVIQIGSPKSVARFLQRAGRSGHQPGELSNIWFVPTHSLEILEAIALQKGYEVGLVEKRQPVMMAWDVLVQYMVTRAVGDGFRSEELYAEIVSSHSFADVTWDEWEWLLLFITQGGSTLSGYQEYHKVVATEAPNSEVRNPHSDVPQSEIRNPKSEILYKVTNRQVALRHRMNIGTIVGDALMRVKFMGGGFIGTIEENFISRLSPGDAFVLAGKKLELIMVKDMDAIVRRSNAKNAIVPSWLGGRLPLSADMGTILRYTYEQAADNPENNALISFLGPLLDMQKELSAIPKGGELLVELIDTRDGHHLFIYPYEGRLVHQAMAAMLAYRMAKAQPISFSIAMSDYGFELLSDQPIPLNEENVREFFNPKDWYLDLQRSINAAELGKRKFRDIATIAGLIFQGYPGAKKKQRHLQNSSSLIYDVLREEEPNHLLLQQADTEALTYEVEAERLYHALERIYSHPIILKRPRQLTPFCFPIKVDSLREQLSSEKLEDRVKRMQEQLNRL
jgi:ATP-dependent Lhr-like helicase